MFTYEIKLERFDTVQQKFIKTTEEIESINYTNDGALVTFYITVNLPGDANYSELNIASFPLSDIVSIKKQ